jgi:hypothetical protein
VRSACPVARAPQSRDLLVQPLAWWLERRLASLAEEACAAAVIRAGHSAQDSSDYLIDMAHALRRQRRRLNVAGMAMPGSGLPGRMRHIFEVRFRIVDGHRPARGCPRRECSRASWDSRNVVLMAPARLVEKVCRSPCHRRPDAAERLGPTCSPRAQEKP